MPTEIRSLRVAEFFLLWYAHHKLSDLPSFLGVNPVGDSRTERAEHTAAASATLAERDLGTIENPAADLREMVGLLAETPARIEFGRTRPEAAAWTVAAVRDGRAVVATRTDLEIRLWTAKAPKFVTDLIEDLPPREPGTGASANAPVVDFQRAYDAAAARGPGAFRDALDRAGVHQRDIPTLARAVEDSTDGGMLAAVRRDDTGTWRHAPVRISWRDTAAGRYAIRQDNAWVTVTPADTARLTSMAGHVLEQVG
ncbi:ESX secretion-associated protein EspG [Actinophytocola gossypii]|uniref:ESX secretion-associated protein EspG n=1 Tax=Actinophytocola gossypii TaxID=2812003 RepID=A0ABT2JAU7_9PSEU|nr:ESX secretion-associated protein EspG [Actinophytocola gossypii]MCT2584999.1 ESX secretion-associated protein EspG [Actinophytocola gossypii]